MELRRRRLRLVNVTEHPHAEWVVQQLRNLSVQHYRLPRFILHDRDGKFSGAFDAFAEASGTRIIKLPSRSPHLNAYAERWVRSVREECLDQIIVLSERHLRYVRKGYVEYFTFLFRARTNFGPLRYGADAGKWYISRVH